MRKMICIVCPRGCAITVDEDNDYEVTGNACPRGVTYGRKEVIAPSRTLTTTVRLKGGNLPLVPVQSKTELPKECLADAMHYLNTLTLEAPVKRGTVVCENILGTGVDILVTRDADSLSNA